MEEFAPCAVCARIPLIGEEVAVIGRGGAESVVCDLCLQKPRAIALGEPLRRDRIRSAAGADCVQRVYPRPVEPGESTVAPPAVAGFLR